jgi:hypothetical protein
LVLAALPCGLIYSQTPDNPYWGIRALPLAKIGTTIKPGISGRPYPREGAVVSEVIDDGPAADAGLKVGDVVTGADGRPIKDDDALRSLCIGSKPGQKIHLDLLRLEPQPQVSAPQPRRSSGGARAAKQVMVWNKHEADLVVDVARPANPCPLKIKGALISHTVIYGDGNIGRSPLPILYVTAGGPKVDAYEIEVEALDKFGGPVKGCSFSGEASDAPVGNVHRIMSQKGGPTAQWTMRGAEGVGVLKCRLLRVKLTDGTVWKPTEGRPVKFEAKLAAE